MKNTQWMIYTKRADFNALAARFSVSPILARIMINRGVLPEEFGDYLGGSLAELPDARLLRDIDRAADILLEKRDRGRRVRIIGDYDIDGVCSTYILYTGLRALGMRVDYDIPDRIRDGYGLNIKLIERAAEEQVDTILTCDNGIAAVEEIERAKACGLTVIVTDHHEPGHYADGSEKLPPADAVVDPKREGSRYPFHDICGAVVAWKLIGLLFVRCGTELREWEALLPFAAIATVGDVMPLKKENRVIVREGLRAVSGCGNPGLRALLELCGLDQRRLTAYHIGYVIGPCLNAGGRLESAKVGLRMLLEKDPSEAHRLAEHLKELNDERKQVTMDGLKEAEAQLDGGKEGVLVVYLPDCHESVAGIIAGKLKERCYRPSIVLTNCSDPELVKGSGRSIEGYHMFQALEAVSDLLVKFGGHPMAAGLTLRREDIGALRQRLNQNAALTEEQLTEKLWIDLALPFSHTSEALVEELARLEPFGQGNEKPVFAQKNVRILSLRVFGKNRNVIKLRLCGEEGTQRDALLFADGDTLLQEKGERECFDILYYPEIDSYMGRNTLQLVLKGWKFRD
ncbi:single-stranded-DNA-specific exonuclease [Fusobacterium naviforme]|nr:single-stranded-DNA-specific exonuclease RecJ [Fusobacterium naviforme]PSL09210.1 single-stranded-DNA-specific exonuclease [Fusobacterium naviforme]STO27801.1 Single-stranded-DNA-specific exonuclease recJ [Fusobacterium naviforme]